ncbi:MAG: hypothetical protein ABW219_02505 [Ilumatobacteraceae bacterium]
MITDPIPRRTSPNERDLDLLADELAVNDRLVRWLCGYCFKESLGEIDTCVTSTSSWDGAIVVEVRFADGSRRRLLIEDELDATVHPDQAARYRRRGDLTEAAGLLTRSVVVGPASSLRAKGAGLAPFHAMVDTEAIVVELRREAEESGGESARRLTWRAQALEAGSARRAPGPRPTLAAVRARSDGHPSVIPYLRPI